MLNKLKWYFLLKMILSKTCRNIVGNIFEMLSKCKICGQMDFFEKCTLSGSKTTNGMEFPIFSATGSVPVKAFSAGVSL